MGHPAFKRNFISSSVQFHQYIFSGTFLAGEHRPRSTTRNPFIFIYSFFLIIYILHKWCYIVMLSCIWWKSICWINIFHPVVLKILCYLIVSVPCFLVRSFRQQSSFGFCNACDLIICIYACVHAIHVIKYVLES